MARFDCALWRPISTNTGGTLSPNKGLFLHHAVAIGSLWGFFNNPINQVSAHFWVSLNGTIEQYVDTNTIAWHARQANATYVGVETEGCVDPPYDQPMTDAMIAALARLYAEGHERHNWPFVLCNSFGDPGFGYHRLAVQTACPCDVRVNRRQEILDRAQGAKPAPPPTPTLEGAIEMDSVVAPNGDIVGHYRTPDNHLLEVTRAAGKQGSAANNGLSIIDITNQYPQFTVVS